MTHSTYHDGLEKFINAFRHDSHPMIIMSILIAAMPTFYPEANPPYIGQ
jgi:citrate synthase